MNATLNPTCALRVRPAPLAHATALLLGVAGASLAAASLTAATDAPRPDSAILWIVENCNDAGPGSLRDAAALALAGDGIDLGGLACSTISVTSGAIALRDVSLIGPGADRLTIDGLGNQNRRIFDHAGAGGVLAISGVTVNGGKYLSNAGLGGGCLRSTGGSVRIRDAAFTNCLAVTAVGADGDVRGGAIAVYGALELSGATISGNWAKTDHDWALGGGVYAQGDVTMRRSTIANNTASGTGGAAQAQGGGLFARESAYIEDSTLDGNSAMRGGGGAIVLRRGTLLRSTVSNNFTSSGASGIAFRAFSHDKIYVYASTISGNETLQSAAGFGGSLYSDGMITTIVNATITGNTESNADGLRHGAGLVLGTSARSLWLYGTIASRNYFRSDATPFLASDLAAGTSVGISGNKNLVGWSERPLPGDTIRTDNPKLGPLQDNGGPTRTHLPLPDSAAIDHGDAHGFDTDQRGYPRVAGAAADIGAVEAGADAIFANGFE